MNYRKIYSDLGSILIVESALLALPTLVAFYYREGFRTICSFVATMAMLLVVGKLMKIKKPETDTIYAREGFMLCAMSWVLMSAFGALPFVISGAIPSYPDALFETVSGFTTTGSTILTDIESLPRSILFWRSFTHFIGGMGILVFVIAVLPKTRGSTIHVMRAEVPGPTVGKLVSRLGVTARILYAIYFAITFTLTMLLWAGGIPLFDSMCTAFGTAGTGGFALLNDSIGGYHSSYAEVVISIFMLLFGLNFNLYYYLLKGHVRQVFKNNEFRWYVGVVVSAVSVITLQLTFTRHPFSESLRYAFFQVSSIITTTGFSSTDFELWPTLSKTVLFLLMFIGGCAGSTGGGLKVSRIIVCVKNGARTIRKAFNPRSVETIKMDGRPVDEDTVRSVTSYVTIYFMIIAVSIFFIAIDGKQLIPTITSVITCINNVGPGYGGIGPTGNFSEFSVFSKMVLCFDMLAGRLELIPMFMIFSKYIIPRKYA